MIKLFKIFFLTFILSFFFYHICIGQEDVGKRQANVLIVNNKKTKLSLRVYDFFLEPKSYYADVNDTINIQLVDSCAMVICQSEKDHPTFLIRNNDKLIAFTDKEDRIKFISLADVKRTDEINFFHFLSKNSGIFTYYMRSYTGSRISLIKRDRLIDSIFYLYDNLLRVYVKKNKLDSSFAFNTRIFLQSYKILYKITFGIGYFKRESIVRYYGRNLNAFFSFFNQDSISSQKLCIIKYSASQVVDFLADRLSLSGGFNFIDENFTSPINSYIKAKLLVNNEQSDKDSLKKYFKILVDNCDDTSLVLIVKEKLLLDDELSNVVLGETWLMDSKGDTLSLGTLLEIYDSKLILIDFWATWCIPCIKESPFIKKLTKDFKTQNIKFLFFSLDKDSELWNRAIKKNLFQSNDDQFLVLNNRDSKLAKKLKIESLPRYVLLYNNDIVDANCIRPSNPQLVKLLSKLLSGK